MGARKGGFTILEVVVSVAILGLIAVLTLQVFHVGTQSWDASATQSRMSAQARRGIERMTRELRNSTLGRVTIAAPNVLQFQVPTAIDENGVITWSSLLQYRLGGVNNQQILREDVGAGGSTVIANSVTNMQFVANANPPTVTITITTQGATPYGITVPITLASSVEFRN